jgi:hypothetical protein
MGNIDPAISRVAVFLVMIEIRVERENSPSFHYSCNALLVSLTFSVSLFRILNDAHLSRRFGVICLANESRDVDVLVILKPAESLKCLMSFWKLLDVSMHINSETFGIRRRFA